MCGPALISEAFLEAPAREAVEFLLGGPGGLARESTWADGVRGGSSPYNWTGPLHYFNTPDFGSKVVRSCELLTACLSHAFSKFLDMFRLFSSSIFAACNYNHTRDCSGQNCVTGAVEDLSLLQDTNMMQGRSIPKGDSLKFMIHFLQGTCYLMYGVCKLLMNASLLSHRPPPAYAWSLCFRPWR